MKCDVTPDVVCHPVGWGGASRVFLVIVVWAVAIKGLTKPYSRVSNSMCFTSTLAWWQRYRIHSPNAPVSSSEIHSRYNRVQASRVVDYLRKTPETLAMANTHRAPKQWCLTKVETVNSFENWHQNLVYTLSLDTEFVPFLVDGARWGKKTRASPFRGFTDDDDEVPAARRRTRQQKVSTLELMLGQIANYCPVISRNTIVKNSTCIDHIWQTIRLHYGFQSTGAHFIDFAAIKLESNEGPEDLYQRLMAFVEDNLLCRDSGITHGGENILEDEELSPTIENLVVLTWLRLIHSDLPKLVKQRYGTELRSRTLASIKPEISQALCSLLDELQSSEDARAMRSAVSNPTS